MENKNFKCFKDDIRKTFTIYALVPVIIITFFSYSISFSILYRTVVNQNYNINTELSKRIEAIVSSYMNKAYKIAKQDNVIEYINSQHISSDIYEEFYSFVNSMDIRCNFFVFDENMQPLIASTTNKPEYAQNENVFSWGITRSMLDTPDQVVLVRESSAHSSKQILSVGKAIVKDGKIIGYVTFDLDERSLVGIISQNFSINVVITDKYGNVISSTNALLINQFGKIDENFRNKSGFIKSINDSHYVTKSEILDKNICIYTITSIGYFGPIFIIVGFLLIVLFSMLTITTYLSARRIADSKTKVIDEIIEAIGNVQNGNLDVLLNINTKDEFQIIAESYNKMLTDIKNLIEINKEKARQSVLSEIKQLESQFNPHFLFNTLETIKYMSKMEPA
ncbi:MAG: histidine kinase, partial [Actinobacteria bacterium]|nr:histidine kinase [Actinomycetota bacterium]